MDTMENTSTAVLDYGLVCRAFDALTEGGVVQALHQRALARHVAVGKMDGLGYDAFYYLTSKSAPPFVGRPPRDDREMVFAIVAAFCGFDASREPGDGYEPPSPPAAYEKDCVTFTSDALSLLVDLVCHEDGPKAVAARYAADILLSTRNRIKGADKDGRNGVERDIARARRMLELTAIPRTT